MFRSMNASIEHEPKSPDFDNTNKKNEITEFASKFNRKNSGGIMSGTLHCILLLDCRWCMKCNRTFFVSGSIGGKSRKKTAATVKPISVKDEKMLNHAIDLANEVGANAK